jgi:hypothetical protein
VVQAFDAGCLHLSGLANLIAWFKGGQPNPLGGPANRVRCELNLWLDVLRLLAHEHPSHFAGLEASFGGEAQYNRFRKAIEAGDLDAAAEHGRFASAHDVEPHAFAAALLAKLVAAPVSSTNAASPLPTGNTDPYMPAQWFDTEFGIPADRLRAARRSGRIKAKNVGTDQRPRYIHRVRDAQSAWPHDVTRLP